MNFSKISAPSLKELFVEELENSIISGRLEIGERLPPERELAEKMQVSRAVVNAGLNEMAARGFVEIRPRVGAVVADYRRIGTAETLLSIMKYNGGRLRKEDIRSIIEIKLVLDKLAVQLLIPKLTPQNLLLLRELLDKIEASENATDTTEASFAFYHELGMLSGNTLIPLMYYSFRVPIFDLWERYARKYGFESLVITAGHLYAAIDARDYEAACRVIERSLGKAIQESGVIYDDEL